MTDIEIAQNTKLKEISVIAKKLGLKKAQLLSYGPYKAKILGEFEPKKESRLILVTAINPTKFGEGKTTLAIGLADALARRGKKVCLALREPSMGPVFGIKGGAAGGGYSQIAPMEEINLHFTGDFHAITSANNLLCALIDNHIFQGNELKIEKVFFKRCLDLNDRALREITLHGKHERDDGFVITAASEIMAIMCLAENLEDLKRRLGNIVVGVSAEGKLVKAKDLHAQEAMAILLKDALKPNLVQTLEGTPAIVHCGPFANIAHGCNSVRATKTALSLADYVVTEAGFGADLGGEKFLDFKCREAGLKVDCVVLACTIRALKLHGEMSSENLEEENLTCLKKGVENLEKHIDTIKNVFHLPCVVALNKFACDTENEVALLKKLLKGNLIETDVWAKGGKGGLTLADEVIKTCQKKSKQTFAYSLNDTIEEKIKKIATKVYGGKGVKFSLKAKKAIEFAQKHGYGKLPVIIAKTQYSLSSDEKLLGAPKDFVLNVEDVEIRGGAEFLVAICGKTLLMPALSKNPAALNMKIDKNEKISGLF